MNVLMLSIAPSLLARTDGKNEQLGDVIKRHREYARFPGIESLTIFVAAQGPFAASEGRRLSVYPTRAGRFGSLFSFVWMALQLSQQKGFDLIVAQDAVALYAFILGFLFGKSVFVTVHGAWGDAGRSFKWFRKYYYAHLLPRLLRRAAGVRTVTYGVKEQLMARGVLAQKIAVIPTAVQIKKFFQKLRRSRFAKKYAGKKVILYVGRIEREKNILFLLEAARRVLKEDPDALFLCAGDGSERAEMEDRVRAMGLGAGVTFLGHVPNDHLRHYLVIAQVFVSPSVSESLGTVCIEAGAAGVPVVAVRNIGSTSIIQDGQTGYLIERGDAQGFADAILGLLRSPKERDEMGRRARRRVAARFDFKKSVEAVPAAWVKAVVGAGVSNQIRMLP